MTSLIPTLMLAMVASLAALFVLFAPPANEVFPKHHECLNANISPDLTQQQRAICREWRKK